MVYIEVWNCDKCGRLIGGGAQEERIKLFLVGQREISVDLQRSEIFGLELYCKECAPAFRKEQDTRRFSCTECKKDIPVYIETLLFFERKAIGFAYTEQLAARQHIWFTEAVLASYPFFVWCEEHLPLDQGPQFYLRSVLAENRWG